MQYYTEGEARPYFCRLSYAEKFNFAEGLETKLYLCEYSTTLLHTLYLLSHLSKMKLLA